MEAIKNKVKKPRLEERETIINFDERYPEADIYTYNQRLQKRLTRFSEEHPECCRLVRTEPEGAMTFYVDKKRLVITMKAPIAEEKRKQYAEQGRKSSLMRQLYGEKSNLESKTFTKSKRIH